MRPGDGVYPWVKLAYVSKPGTGHTPSRQRPELWIPDECTIPWFTLADVWQLRDDTVVNVMETETCVSQAGLENSAAVLHPAGTVLLSRTASVGFSAVMGRDMAVSQDFITWTPAPRLRSHYLLYVLRALRPHLRGLMYGSTHKTIYMPDLLALRAPVPPVQAQDVIVDFLDQEGARIESLRGEIRRAHGLLAEQLTGYFNALLDGRQRTDVPLRRVIRSIADGPFGSSLASEHYTENEDVRVVRLGNVGRAEFRDEDRAYISSQYANSALSAHYLRGGDVIVAGLGDTNHPLGRACVVPDDLGPAIHKADCYRVVVDADKCVPEYLAIALSYGPAVEFAPLLSRGATRSRLNTVVARELPVPLIDVEEQREVADIFQRKRAEINAIAQQYVDLDTELVEYRQALIAEAVTGQVDLMGRSSGHRDVDVADANVDHAPKALA